MLARVLMFRDSLKETINSQATRNTRYRVGNADDENEIKVIFCISEAEVIRQLRIAEGEVDGVILSLPRRAEFYTEIQKNLDRLLIPHAFFTGNEADIKVGALLKGGGKGERIQINPACKARIDGAFRTLAKKIKMRHNGNGMKSRVQVDVIRSQDTALSGHYKRIVREAQLNAVREVATGLAHELNNLITPIVGYTQLIKSKIDDELIYRKLEIIEDSAFRSSNLISDLLIFTGSTEIDLERTNARLLFEKIQLLSGERAETIDVSVNDKIGDWDGFVECDKKRMLDAIGRIIDNAVVSVSGAGMLFLEYRKEEINMHTRRKYGLSVDRRRNSVFREADIPDGSDVVVFEVRDNGVGMDEKTVGQAVFPFYTGRPPQIDRGLGLAMAYGVIQSHGGVLSVRSKPGIGTCVNILLPIVSTGGS